MKANRFFLLFLTLHSLLAFDFDTTKVAGLDSLAENPVLLNQPWRFHHGDSSIWATADFDHSDWDTMSTMIAREHPYFGEWRGIGWYRRVLEVDSSMFGQQVATFIVQSGASEIYLNGRFIKRFGRIYVDSLEHAYNPLNQPFTMRFDSTRYQVLAVRLANYSVIQNHANYMRHRNMTGFQMQFNELNAAMENAVERTYTVTIFNSLFAGLFVALGLLHFILFLFYSRHKQNIYYVLFTLGIGIILFQVPFSFMLRGLDLVTEMYLRLGIFIMLVAMFVGYIGFLYSIFYQRFPKHSYVLILFSVVMPILIMISPSETIINAILAIYVIVMSAEGLRVIISALRQKLPDAWVIGAGVVFFFGFIMFAIASNVVRMDLPGPLIFIILVSGILGLPLSMSVYLARKIARTNNNLETQLQKVQELSDKAVENEKRNAALSLAAEREKSSSKEAELRAKAAELQAQAAEAQSRAIQAEHERKTKELEEARKLQLSLLPRKVPQIEGLAIDTFIQTATEVGGDYYDFVTHEDGTLTAAIGDATGHGLQAGTLVTATKSLFNARGKDADPAKILSSFNRNIRDLNLRFLFMCLALVRIKGTKLEIVSAGMPPALLYRQESGEVESIALKGLPLGSYVDVEFKSHKTQFLPGDTLLLWSDGLPELLNSSGEMFGYERVAETFANIASDSPAAIVAELNRQGNAWNSLDNAHDDITYVVIKAV
jgi:serine phosphatase RsbU (regulator of sigma subunit)